MTETVTASEQVVSTTRGCGRPDCTRPTCGQAPAARQTEAAPDGGLGHPGEMPGQFAGRGLVGAPACAGISETHLPMIAKRVTACTNVVTDHVQAADLASCGPWVWLTRRD